MRRCHGDAVGYQRILLSDLGSSDQGQSRSAGLISGVCFHQTVSDGSVRGIP